MIGHFCCFDVSRSRNYNVVGADRVRRVVDPGRETDVIV